MKGLFYKEGRCLWQYGKSYILLVVIFFGLTFLNKGGGGANPLWLLYPVFFVGSLPASLLSADERDGWLAYCDTLPIGLAAACSGEVCYQRCADGAHHHVGAAYQRAYRAAYCGRRHSPCPLSILIPLLLAVGLGVPALMFPVMFKFGATKGRAVYIAVVMIASATCGVLMASESVRGVLTVLPILPVIIITLAIFVGSWALSVKWFKAREL